MSRGKLSSLTDERLLARTQKLAGLERRVTINILSNLNEIERRRLHLKLGYGSLFDYCVEHLGYSAPAAGRRIRSARCIRDFPEAHEMLERNEINLTTLTMIAGILTKENSAEVLAEVKNKSKREVEVLKARYAGPVLLHDRMRPVRVVVPEKVIIPDRNNNSTLASESETGMESDHGCVEKPSAPVDKRPRMTVQKRITVQFTATPLFAKKFDEVRGLLMHRFAGCPSYEQVFDVVLDLFLNRYSPVRRKERRETRARKNTDQTPKRAARRTDIHSRQREWSNERKPVPIAMKDKIHSRSGGRCEYVNPAGRRCNSTVCAQVDHIVPVARGGTSEPANLRLLCAAHNRLEAERVLGSTRRFGSSP